MIYTNVAPIVISSLSAVNTLHALIPPRAQSGCMVELGLTASTAVEARVQGSPGTESTSHATDATRSWRLFSTNDTSSLISDTLLSNHRLLISQRLRGWMRRQDARVRRWKISLQRLAASEALDQWASWEQRAREPCSQVYESQGAPPKGQGCYPAFFAWRLSFFSSTLCASGTRRREGPLFKHSKCCCWSASPRGASGDESFAERLAGVSQTVSATIQRRDAKYGVCHGD